MPITSTLSVVEGGSDLDLGHNRRLRALLAPAAWENISRAREAERARDDFIRMRLQKEMAFERALVAAGGALMVGCDPTGDAHTIAGLGDQRNIELLAQAGFTIPQVIRFATLNGAAFEGRDHDIGSVEIGKRADLVLLNGDLMADVNVIERPEIVFKNGVGYNFRGDLRQHRRPSRSALTLMRDTGEQPSWIGARPSNTQIFALMYCGVVGLLIPGLQPLLLGALAEDGRLRASQLGVVATAELLAMGLTAGLAGSFIKASRLKLIAVAAFAALAAIDLATTFVSGDALTLARAFAGAPSGVLVWITIAFIARTPTPERWAGAYVTAQTLCQFVAVAAATALFAPGFNANGALCRACGALCGKHRSCALIAERARAAAGRCNGGFARSARLGGALSVVPVSRGLKRRLGLCRATFASGASPERGGGPSGVGVACLASCGRRSPRRCLQGA